MATMSVTESETQNERMEIRSLQGQDAAGMTEAGAGDEKARGTGMAEEAANQKKRAVGTQKQPWADTDPRPFAFYCDEWLSLRRSEISESTFVKYASILEKHIKPELGKYGPPALDTKQIENFKWYLLKSCKLAPKTAKDILCVLRTIIKYMDGQIPDIMKPLEFHYPKVNKKEMRVLTPDEQHRLTLRLLLNLNPCTFGILLALLTGLRIGELCALTWKNVSMRDRVIRICATMQRMKTINGRGDKKTKLWIGSPKSDASCRIIPMPDSVVRLCGKMRLKNKKFYILTASTRPMEPRTLQNRLKKYARECGIEDIHFHTLRHSFATRCVESGFEIKSLSEVLGHANTAITLDCYVHSSMALKRANMDRVISTSFF